MNQGPRRPDFFIVGAPKAGTTSLHAYLRRHPQVYMPVAKELHFFGSDLEFRRTPRISEAEYLGYFTDVPDAARRVGEASVRYLQSLNAAAEIATFSPHARIVIMLRNPVEALPAMHSEYLFSGLEDISDFASALAAEPDRKAGRRIPDATNVPQVLYYRESVRYSDQVERYIATFGPSRVHIIVFDDFKADSERVYRTTLEFLGVDTTIPVATQVINPNKVARSRLATRLISNPPAALRALARLVDRPTRKRLYRWLLNLNARTARRQPMDDQLRDRLVDEFAPEVDRLAKLIGRDLSAWTSP